LVAVFFVREAHFVVTAGSQWQQLAKKEFQGEKSYELSQCNSLGGKGNQYTSGEEEDNLTQKHKIWSLKRHQCGAILTV